MNINQMTTSPYLRAADIESDSLTLTIDALRQEEIGQNKDLKWVLYFRETDKGLVLNVTNTKTIGNLHGPETDYWMGKPITLFVTTVNMNGESKEAIRVSPRPARGTQQQQPIQQSVPQQGFVGQTYQQPTQQQQRPAQGFNSPQQRGDEPPF